MFCVVTEVMRIIEQVKCSKYYYCIDNMKWQYLNRNFSGKTETITIKIDSLLFYLKNYYYNNKIFMFIITWTETFFMFFWCDVESFRLCRCLTSILKLHASGSLHSYHNKTQWFPPTYFTRYMQNVVVSYQVIVRRKIK